MAYKAPHDGLERVIAAARAVSSRLAPYSKESAELQAALHALDNDEGMMATKDEAEAAIDIYERSGIEEGGGYNVDRYGSALVSHGDDGYWVSGWLFVPTPAEEEDENDED